MPTGAAAHGDYARVAVQIPAANRGYGRTHAMTLPRGWTAEVWALVPRGSPGDLDARERSAREPAVWRHHHRARTARSPQPAATETHTRVGPHNPQGMAFDRFGGHEVLYVAESDELDRYEWRGHGVGARTVVIRNLPDGGSHPLKNVVVGRDHTVYIDARWGARSPSSAGSRSRTARTGAEPSTRYLAPTELCT